MYIYRYYADLHKTIENYLILEGEETKIRELLEIIIGSE